MACVSRFWRLTGSFKLPVSVNVFVFVSMSKLCDKLVICAWCTLLHAECQLAQPLATHLCYKVHFLKHLKVSNPAPTTWPGLEELHCDAICLKLLSSVSHQQQNLHCWSSSQKHTYTQKFAVWHIPASFTLLTAYLQIRQIIQHKHIICDPAQDAHLSWISIQMMWGMISDYRWGLKERCRNEGNATEGSHNDFHSLSPQAKTASQSVSVWMEFHEGWMENQFKSWTSKRKSFGQYSQFVSKTKWWHTSLQDGFEPDPLESFVIENTRSITT